MFAVPFSQEKHLGAFVPPIQKLCDPIVQAQNKGCGNAEGLAGVRLL